MQIDGELSIKMAKVLASSSSNRSVRFSQHLKSGETRASQNSGTLKQSKPSVNNFSPGLYIVATPIGNSGDLGHRAVQLLARASLIVCEDTRVTSKLLNIYGIQSRTLAYHEHNAQRQLPRILKRLQNGETIALVCDAGTPLISDPGYRLVQACIKCEVLVSSIPGASAVLAALVISGMPTNQFFFQGFLPNKKGLRRSQLRKLATVPGSLIFLESTKRLASMLADALEELGNRRASVCRELTKKFEEIRRGYLSELVDYYLNIEPPKGEISIVIGPASGSDVTNKDKLDEMLIQALEKATVRDASTIVAKTTGLSRREVYARAIALSRNPQ